MITLAASTSARILGENISRIRQAAGNAVAAMLAMDRQGMKLVGRREKCYHVEVNKQKFVASSLISIIKTEMFFKCFRDYWEEEKICSSAK